MKESNIEVDNGFLADAEIIEVPKEEEKEKQNLNQDQKTQSLNQDQKQKTSNGFLDDAEKIDIADLPKEMQTTGKKDASKTTEYVRKNVMSEMPAYAKKEFFRNPELVREQTSYDTKKLGSKVWFKPTAAEELQNEKIDKAKEISTKATAYTLEIRDTLNEAYGDFQEKYFNFEAEGDEVEEDRLARLYLTTLSSVSFTAKMFSSAYIRKHLYDCYTLIRAYEGLEELPYLSDAYREQKEAYKDIMELFTKRVNEFCLKNHVDMTDHTGFDGELSDDQKITDEDINKWLLLTDEAKTSRKDKRKNEYFEKQSFAARGILDENIAEHRDNLNQYMTEVDAEAQLDDTVEEIFELDKGDRIKKLPEIKGTINYILDLYKDNQLTDPEAIMNAKKKVAEYRALQRAIEAEIRYDLAVIEHGEGSKEVDKDSKVFNELVDCYEDVRKMIKRAQKPLDLMCETTTHSSITTVTRQEAISTSSDRKSFQKRAEILRIAGEFKKAAQDEPQLAGYAGEVYALAKDYFENSFYKVGAGTESEKIKALKKKLKENQGDFNLEANLEALRQKVDELTNGSLEFIDFERRSVNANYIDTVHPDVRYPTTSGDRQITFFTKVREDALRKLRKWKNPGADAPIFTHEPTVNDLRQGKVSNCWMVAATTGLIDMDPQIIKNAIRDNGDGTVTVRLFTSEKIPGTNEKRAKPNYIKMNKEVPTLFTGGAIHSSGALWMQLLEKAAAFLGYKSAGVHDPNRGYDALWYGEPADWAYALTGVYGERIINSITATGAAAMDENVSMGRISGITKVSTLDDYGNDIQRNTQFKNELFNEMLHAKEKGYMYTYASKKKDADGMNDGHAYTVLSVGEENGERFVLLRNPYGNMNTAYQDDGKLYRTDYFISSQFNETFGQFRIKYSDFLKNVGALARVKVK